MRTFDGISTAREIGAIAALTQCLVEHFSRELDAGRDVPTLQPWFVRENKWRAARYGMDAIIIQNAAGDERLVTEDSTSCCRPSRRSPSRSAARSSWSGVRDIIDRGASYQRQLRVAAANGGSLKAVVSALVRELRDGHPI